MQKLVFVAATLLCLIPIVSTPLALLAGLFFGLTLKAPWPNLVQKWTKWLLQISVVGLGFGIPVTEVLQTGKEHLPIAFVTIAIALIAGLLLAHLIAVESTIAKLITVGTGICGGSAIAAVAPVLHAKAKEISVALAAVFTLNAAALFLFPFFGKLLHMSDESFGLWAAIAIHDTSSVVGAATVFGEEALKIATTVKLSRVIFIVPIVLVLGLVMKKKGSLAIPYFIVFFVVAAFARAYLPHLQESFQVISQASKQALCVVLFWVGSSINRGSLIEVGLKPFVFAVSLWLVVAITSLLLIQGAIFL